MAQDYAENLLKAVEILADYKIVNAGYDKTIKATVTSAADAGNGIYSCKYEAVTFTAIGDKNAYKENDIVMITIPQNNWDNIKTILNKVYTEEIDTKSLDPFSSFLDVNDGKPLLFTDIGAAVAANDYERTSRPIGYVEETQYNEISDVDFSTIYTEPYTRMGIEVALKTAQLTSLYQVNGGNYGISLKFYKDTALLVEQVLNTQKMIGNLYNFGDYTTQKLLIALDPTLMSEVTKVRADLFQSNDFTQYNKETGETQRLSYSPVPASQVDDNIFAKGIKLYFGYSKEDIKDGDLTLNLDSNSDIQYYFKWDNNQNTKSFNGVYWEQNKTTGEFNRYLFDTSKWHNNDYGDYAGQYNATNNNGDIKEIYLEKQTAKNEWVQINTIPYLLESEDLAQSSVNFRARVTRSNFDTDTDTLSSYKYSNEVTLYQWRATVSSLERDLESALSMSYHYEDLEELKYNDMENQLLTQKEHMLPHSFYVHWNPLTEELKDPTFFAGATVTYKVPAFDDREYGKNVDKANERFEFESTTVIQHPEQKWEYGSNNSSIRQEIIDGISYLCWDLILSDDFGYSDKVYDKYHWWGEDDQTSCDMQAFVLDLRPKEYYLPSMVNNTIYCTIKTSTFEFNTSIEFPIEEVNTSETLNRTFILTEDMKKPYLLSYQHGSDTDIFITSKIFHFCTYRENYNGEKNFTGSIEVMRDLGDYDNHRQWLKDGYWYYENNELIESTPVVTGETNIKKFNWYTLDLRGPILISDVPNLDFLMLQTKNGGITSIIDIPIYYFRPTGLPFSSPYQEVLEGINRLYFGSNGINDTYGPQDMCYKTAYLCQPDSTRLSEYCKEYIGETVQLISQEEDKNSIFYPEISRESLNTYYTPFLGEIGSLSVALNYYYKYNNNYCLGVREHDAQENQEVNYYYQENTSSQKIKVFSITSSQLPYTADSSSHLYQRTDAIAMFLRFNQPGFTKNYKEVGVGDAYPAETAKSYHTTLPIVFQQRQLYRDDFVQWDGTKVQIGEDAVQSPLIGAGRKDDQGKFSGCLMGDISTIDFSTENNTALYGLYGYHEDEQSFGLRADGTMFIGKKGNGQLLLDGNSGVIQSGNYAVGQNKGMMIDLDDAIIEMKNNDSAMTPTQKEEKIEELDGEISNFEGELNTLLTSAYNTSGIYDYIVTQDATPVSGKKYYYVPFAQPDNSLVLTSYYLSLDEEANGTKTYYILNNSTYIPVTPSQGTSVWSGPVDTTQPRDPDKVYYIKDNEDNYIPQTPDDSWEVGETYYERQYYWYEKVDSEGYDYTPSLTYFTAAQGSTWPQADTVYYEKTLPSNAPSQGYNFRVYGGEYEGSGSEPTSADGKHYFHVYYPNGSQDYFYWNNSQSGSPSYDTIYYKKLDQEPYQEQYPLHITRYLGKKASLTGQYNYWFRNPQNGARLRVYYDGSWRNVSEDIPDLTHYAKYKYIDRNLNDLTAKLNERKGDECVSKYETSEHTSEECYNNYDLRRIDYEDKVEEYNEAFYNELNYPKILADTKAVYEAEEPIYTAAYEAYLADPTNVVLYDAWQTEKAIFEPIEEAYIQAQNIAANHTTLFDEAQVALNSSYHAKEIALNAYLDSLNHIPSSSEASGMRLTWVDYYSHVVANEGFEEALNNYLTKLDEYNDKLNEKVIIYQTTAVQGTDQGIKLDASDNNLYDGQGRIDHDKFPLIIGKYDDPEFKVDWSGKMFSSAGKIAKWTISKYKLTSEDGDCFLASSKKGDEDYAISIAKGNFKVDWNGNIHANTIYLGKKGGVLDGDENGKTVIKNINMVNNNGKGLNFDSEGNLLLDVGLKIGGDKIILDGNAGEIKLMSGGKITCGDKGTGLSINGSYFEFDCPVKFSGATVEIPYSTRLLLFGGGVLNGTLTIKNQVVEWKTIKDGDGNTVNVLGY